MFYNICMPHLYKKTFGGRTYWYLREVHRVGRKVRVKWQKYLGTPETILARMEESERPDKPLRLRTEMFGALFLAHLLEKELDTIGIVDRVLRRMGNEKGPTVGEYFFYAWANRMIDPKSKRALEDWYRRTAVEHIRPVDLGQLTSERYWDKWDRVSEAMLQEIGEGFLERLWRGREESPESLLFDTTNYFTYMATKTRSELSVRGRNKSGKHHLRQVGLGLLVDRATSLPLYYTVYPGNLHDSNLFHRVMDEILGVIAGFRESQKQITVIFDKGMNSEENIALIDGKTEIHFITTYSTYFADYLARRDPRDFGLLEIPKNQRLREKERENDLIRAYRTSLNLWGQNRTVVVTLNPTTQRKKHYDFTRKMDRIRGELLEYRRKYNHKEPHWRNRKKVISRYHELCDDLHIHPRYYRISFSGQTMGFRKDAQEVARTQALMGKNIIVTDNHDWTTEQIVGASLDRSRIEKQFRVSKAPCHVRVNPIFHWTDSKIRCHLLTCLIALSALRLLELRVGQGLSAQTIIEEMRNLNLVLTWPRGQKKPHHQIEDPNPVQAKILAALGHKIENGSVLQV